MSTALDEFSLFEVDHDAAGHAVFLHREADKTADRAYARALESGRIEPGPREHQKTGDPPAPPDPFATEYINEAGYLDGDYVQQMLEVSAEDRRFAFSAEGAYAGVCKERTGAILDDEKLKKASRQAAELLSLSEEIAQKMSTVADPAAVREMLDLAETLAASAGADRRAARKAYEPIARALAPRFNAYRENNPIELSRYFLHSREKVVLPDYRRIRFIPYVAQTLRAPMVAALDYWLSKHLHARFWTFTSGIRVQLSGVTDRTTWLHDRLRRLNATKFMRAAGVEIVFRSTEMGTPKGDAIETDETGQMYFHVHAHCVVELKCGYMSPTKWEKLLRRVHQFWQCDWSDDGVIAGAREVCKYVTKPAEMRKLSGEQLVALEEQLSGLHLVQAMGSLAEEIRAREECPTGKERLVKRMTPDGRVYVVVKDWNRHVRRTRLEAGQDAAQKLTPSKLSRGEVSIVSRGVPRFGAAGVAEPCVTVMCMRGCWNEESVRAHPLVAPAITLTREQFAKGVEIRAQLERLGINVHTRTVTVLPERPARPRGKPKRQRIGAARAGF